MEDLRISVRDTSKGTFSYKLPPCVPHASLPTSKRAVNKRTAVKIDAFTRDLIIKEIDSLHREQKQVTVADLFGKLAPSSNSISSKKKLLRLLHGIGYSFKQISNRSVLYDNPFVVKKREKFLQDIREMRTAGTKLFYTDETWFYRGMSHRRDWISNMTPEEKKKKGLCSGPNTPASHGTRAIILHTVGENGFLEGALRIFKGKKSDPDYHKEMCGEVFEKYITDLIPLLKAQGSDVCLVLDNARYHNRLSERVPNSQWSKAEILEFLRRHKADNGATERGRTKKDLLGLVEILIGGRKEDFEVRTVDEILKAAGIKVLRLPPYHCEFNPIELVWGWIKGRVRSIAKSEETIDQMEAHVRRFLETIPQATIANFFQHVVNVRKSF
ncbi:hypothetical protein L596_027648 [Steinernema carpocapsae]|nr:hypothetical protein L596_027648 [Steinernema carpocapsae]